MFSGGTTTPTTSIRSLYFVFSDSKVFEIPLLAQLPAPAEFDVSGASGWLDTSIDLRAGDAVMFTASGTLKLPQGKSAGPAGASRGFTDVLRNYPAKDAGMGALIGRVG